MHDDLIKSTTFSKETEGVNKRGTIYLPGTETDKLCTTSPPKQVVFYAWASWISKMRFSLKYRRHSPQILPSHLYAAREMPAPTSARCSTQYTRTLGRKPVQVRRKHVNVHDQRRLHTTTDHDRLSWSLQTCELDCIRSSMTQRGPEKSRTVLPKLRRRKHQYYIHGPPKFYAFIATLCFNAASTGQHGKLISIKVLKSKKTPWKFAVLQYFVRVAMSHTNGASMAEPEWNITAAVIGLKMNIVKSKFRSGWSTDDAVQFWERY